MPNLAIKDIEDMSLTEIDKRIKILVEWKNNEGKNSLNRLYTAIQFGTAKTGKKSLDLKNERSFYKYLDKAYPQGPTDTNNNIDDIDDVKEFMEVLSGKK